MVRFCNCRSQNDLEMLDYTQGNLYIIFFFGLDGDSLDDYCVELKEIHRNKKIHTSYKTFKMLIKWLKNVNQLNTTTNYVNEKTEETMSIELYDLYTNRCKVSLNGDNIEIQTSEVADLIKLDQSIAESIMNHRADIRDFENIWIQNQL